MTDEVGTEQPKERGNPELAQIKAKVGEMAKGLPKPLQQSYDSIVHAGMKLMWSDETGKLMDEYLQSIQNPQDVPNRVAHLIIKGLSIIIQQANIPADLGDPFYAASMLAGKYLMCDALEYVEAQKGIEIDNPIIDQTTKELTSGLFKLYGIDEGKMQGATELAEKYAGHRERFKENGARPPVEGGGEVVPMKKPEEEQGQGLLNSAV